MPPIQLKPSCVSDGTQSLSSLKIDVALAQAHTDDGLWSADAACACDTGAGDPLATRATSFVSRDPTQLLQVSETETQLEMASAPMQCGSFWSTERSALHQMVCAVDMGAGRGKLGLGGNAHVVRPHPN